MKWWKHLSTINHHKALVMKHCFKCGLIKQAFLHDLSKYSWVEFSTGVKYYQGTRSPNAAEREDKGYTEAWLHHKGRNKHHLEYWIDYSLDEGEQMAGMRMPEKYVVEMFCDRVAACENYQKDKFTPYSPLNYYEKGKDKYLLHPETRELLEKLLHMYGDDGPEATYEYIRREILKNKK